MKSGFHGTGRLDVSQRHLSFCWLIPAIMIRYVSEGNDLQIDEEIAKALFPWKPGGKENILKQEMHL